jgi:hypothetical protein
MVVQAACSLLSVGNKGIYRLELHGILIPLKLKLKYEQSSHKICHKMICLNLQCTPWTRKKARKERKGRFSKNLIVKSASQVS